MVAVLPLDVGGCYIASMTYLVVLFSTIIVACLAGAVWVIFALLRRLDAANSALQSQAAATLAMAQDAARSAPHQMERMMDSLASTTERIHSTIESTVKAVLAPPPMQVIDGVNGVPYAMPTMNEGKESAPWDHTDIIMPDWPNPNPTAVMGYEDENDPDFDEENPFGIPGMKFVVQ